MDIGIFDTPPGLLRGLATDASIDREALVREVECHRVANAGAGAGDHHDAPRLGHGVRRAQEGEEQGQGDGGKPDDEPEAAAGGARAGSGGARRPGGHELWRD